MTQHCLQGWMELVPISKGHLMNSESLLICKDDHCNLLLRMILPAFQNKLSKHISPIGTCFRRWGCHLKASNLFMTQMIGSWKKRKSNYFSIPLPKLPVVFNVLSLSPVPFWNSFPRHSCSLPRGSAAWCDIPAALWACWFPVGKSSVGLDHCFGNSLTWEFLLLQAP